MQRGHCKDSEASKLQVDSLRPSLKDVTTRKAFVELRQAARGVDLSAAQNSVATNQSLQCQSNAYDAFDTFSNLQRVQQNTLLIMHGRGTAVT